MNKLERLMEKNEIKSMKKPTESERIAELEKEVETLTFALQRISENVLEVAKRQEGEMPTGDYVNPIQYKAGMSVEEGLFYTDGDNIWEAMKTGTPVSFEDTEYFDIIVV